MYQLVVEVVEEEELLQVVVEVVQVSALDAARLLLSFVQSLLANGGYNFVHMLFCPAYMGICTCKKQHCSCSWSAPYSTLCNACRSQHWFSVVQSDAVVWIGVILQHESLPHSISCLNLQTGTRHSACCQECVFYPFGCLCELLVGIPVRINLFAGGAAAEKEEEKKDEPEEESDEVGTIWLSSLVLEQ